MTKSRMRLVGEGDDSIREWQSPIGDYLNVVSICDWLNEFDFDFSFSDLEIALRDAGWNNKLGRGAYFDDTADFLEALLSPHLHLVGEGWGGDSPGRSGFYKQAYLELGHTKELRKILQIADSFIAKWSETSGLKAAIDLAENEQQGRAALVLRQSQTSNYDTCAAVTIGNFRRNVFCTVSFDAQFGGMNEAKHFMACPVAADHPVDRVMVQGGSRIGYICKTTGNITLAGPFVGGAFPRHLPLVRPAGKLDALQLLLLMSNIANVEAEQRYRHEKMRKLYPPGSKH